MKSDITKRKDIELLVNTFYQKVRSNSTLGYIFQDVAKINWDNHLPRMYSFWASILLGEHSFSGNPMQKHIALSKLTEMKEKEFSEWLLLFTETVDELFKGEKANEAKQRAGNIARLMFHKIQTV
ncbi:MAG: group III truncated hemoglobin [Balneolaceae bacterium]|nr:group III truncated hemoglobin [Balneolaceae bacterium]MBO6546448.1 group III truncated hemoglobin [Balneolaceae bacterium]MBO6648807.1 group III truncated hemoglobin [Balneolaceae bacterium]